MALVNCSVPLVLLVRCDTQRRMLNAGIAGQTGAALYKHVHGTARCGHCGAVADVKSGQLVWPETVVRW
ncbi:hypothetical protein N7533_007487 [Penicillium manginii]|jgi:hypothetical protein|uniref:uncharacterized protein n=1 Tax=Penicillium manginii TaxID=203109 RepID=UPI0025494D2B|nr:uncharacterized protein N7533_007487 [Penicillium manginii]KAJ5750459.1 hypothetical protein N7533_007487 [Penicillium manginii]